MLTKMTTKFRNTLTTTPATISGATSRRSGLSPSTIIASISSRIVRAPSSAQTADPPTPASSSAVMIGEASRSTPMASAAPTNEVAPIWAASAPTCSAIATPSGMDTRMAGSRATLTRNQERSTNSLNWNLRRTRSEPSPYSEAPNIVYRPPTASSVRRNVLGRASETRSPMVTRLR